MSERSWIGKQQGDHGHRHADEHRLEPDLRHVRPNCGKRAGRPSHDRVLPTAPRSSHQHVTPVTSERTFCKPRPAPRRTGAGDDRICSVGGPCRVEPWEQADRRRSTCASDRRSGARQVLGGSAADFAVRNAKPRRVRPRYHCSIGVWSLTPDLADQRIPGESEDALADLVALDLGRAAGDRHAAMHQHQDVAQRAGPVHEQ